MSTLLAQSVKPWQAEIYNRTRGLRVALSGRAGFLPLGWTLFLVLELLVLTLLWAGSSSSSEARARAAADAALEQVGPWNASSVIDPTKVAFLLESRASNMLVPLLLHYIAVTPPDWEFRFMGSDESMAFLQSVPAIQRQIKSGKLRMQYLPSNVIIKSQEALSAFLTASTTWTELLPEAEMVYVFQNDAMVCANSGRNINEFTQYSWVGAPWAKGGDGRGGNGGLSLRNGTAMRYVTSIDKRLPNTEAEDVWYMMKFDQYGIKNLATWTEEAEFSAEVYWHPQPMGYHFGGGGQWMWTKVWGTPDKRAQNYDWCPEVKMILDMDPIEFVPGHCGATWNHN